MRLIEITKGGNVWKYEMPTSWEEVTVADFKKWSLSIVDTKGIEIIIKSIWALSGCPEEWLWDASEDDLNDLAQSIQFIMEPVKVDTQDTIEIEGELYHVKRDFNTLSVGEVKAIEELMAGNLLENFNILLTLFVRRKQEGEWQPLTPKLLEEKWKFDEVKISHVYGLFEDFQRGDVI